VGFKKLTHLQYGTKCIFNNILFLKIAIGAT
jgi:hypothetical protein